MDAIIPLFLKAVHSRIGMAVQWLVGAALGALVTWLTTLGIEIPPDVLEKLTTALVATGIWLVTALVQSYQSKRARELQETVGALKDGWIGDETIRIAEDAMKRVETARKL